MTRVFDPQDPYFKKAKDQNYRARSVFKLEEIQKKFKIIRKGHNVLDLGAAPGSWSQYASKLVGDEGRVVAVDLQTIKQLPTNVDCYVYDVFSDECSAFLEDKYKSFNILLSDMAPKTSGIKDKDQWESVELGLRVLELAQKMLMNGGSLVVKIFQGADFNMFWSKCKRSFKIAKIIKPQAVRSTSREVYVVATGYKRK